MIEWIGRKINQHRLKRFVQRYGEGELINRLVRQGWTLDRIEDQHFIRRQEIYRHPDGGEFIVTSWEEKT